ncbi:hypothetical protein CHS0354_015646 [Potamilus streckersoni]|uniref:C1q domain-containing protein n=1 Tax=Potamilus streckersoni TaxID=2493646 RepID=A0AAE0SF15_9BIVA|nr:hypothetical protein CHS0354_015646 [Potamilus streckersoni]
MYYRLAISVLVVITIQHYQHIFVTGEICLEHGEDSRNLYDIVKELEKRDKRMEELESRVAEQGKIIEQLVGIVKRYAKNDGSEMDSTAEFVYQNTTGTSLVKNKTKLKSVVSSGHGVRRGVVPDHVAFTAFLDHPLTGLAVGMAIRFSGTLLNDGNGYNIYTGIFTVPVEGTYLFTFSIVRINANQLVAKLVVDGAGMVDAIADPAVGLHEHQGTNAAIIHLKKGQSVWIEAFHLESDTLFSLTNDRYCTFAGVLLY